MPKESPTRLETLSAREVAKEMGISPMMVKFLIKSGLPIGYVCRNPKSSRDRVIIFKERWEKYKRGEL